MPRCDACGATILFGGVKTGGFVFCGEKCREQGGIAALASQVPEDVVMGESRRIQMERCPKCQGPGPLDVHAAHTIWSALVVSSWKSTPHVCCRACGRRAQLKALAGAVVLGWWGIPWGLLMTPVQIAKNILGIFRDNSRSGPSDVLKDSVRRMIGFQLAEEYDYHHAPVSPAPPPIQ